MHQLYMFTVALQFYLIRSRTGGTLFAIGRIQVGPEVASLCLSERACLSYRRQVEIGKAPPKPRLHADQFQLERHDSHVAHTGAYAIANPQIVEELPTHRAARAMPKSIVDGRTWTVLYVAVSAWNIFGTSQRASRSFCETAGGAEPVRMERSGAS